jgi:hypothetical protein
MSLPFNFPSTIGVFGSSQVGKTTFVLKIIENADLMFTTKPIRILYCFSAWQSAYDKLSKLPYVTLNEGVPTRAQMEEFTYDRAPTLLVLDDLMAKIIKDPDVQHYVTVLGHHNNIGIILIMQSIFPQGKCARTISLNCHYMVLFNNRRDLNQIKVLSRQIMPGRSDFFMDSYKKAVKCPFAYLLVDIHPLSDPQFELRTRIFPDDEPLIVYQPSNKNDNGV